MPKLVLLCGKCLRVWYRGTEGLFYMFCVFHEQQTYFRWTKITLCLCSSQRSHLRTLPGMEHRMLTAVNFLSPPLLCAPSTSTFRFLFLPFFFLSLLFPLLALPFLLALLVFLPHQPKKRWTKHLGTNLTSPEKLELLKHHVYAPVPSEFNIDLIYFVYNFNVCIIKFYFVLLSLHCVGIFIFLDHAHNCNSPCIIVKQYNSPLSGHTSVLSHFF